MSKGGYTTSQGNSAKRRLLQDSAREDKLVRALQECQAITDAGEAIDRATMLSKYPDISQELSACLDGLELMPVQAGIEPNGPLADYVANRKLSPSATLGDFRLEREIGRGGMGVVYEAEQLSVGRRVALKVLPYAAMLDNRQVARFQNEARAAATLEHPHIVPVYFVGSERGVHYYAMRLIEGKNLSDVLHELRNTDPTGSVATNSVSLLDLSTPKSPIQQRRRLGDSETLPEHRVRSSTSFETDGSNHGIEYTQFVAKIAKQIAEALEFAHRGGIVHRDIKPANIMLDDFGDAWVTDFGLARIENDAGMTMTGDLLGTLRYMSPEQVTAKRALIDHRTDVYSLGVTVYELLAQKPLFTTENRGELVRSITTEEPQPLSKINPKIPRDLETIVLKAMQKCPQDRYFSAGEMAEDLGCFLRSEPIQARRTPLVRRMSLWFARHPIAVWTLSCSLVLLTLLAIAIPLVVVQTQARRQAEKTAHQTMLVAKANAARAVTHEYFATVSEIGELSLRRPAGWSWDALEKIQLAAGLDADGKDLVQLRSLAANALTDIDIRSFQRFAPEVDPGAISISGDGRLFAIGEVRPAPNKSITNVFLFEIDPLGQRVVPLEQIAIPYDRELLEAAPTGPEGVRSLAFSPDGSKLAIGTRYGQIFEWNLDAEGELRQLVSMKPNEDQRVVQLSYTSDGQFLVSCVNGVKELRIIELNTSPSVILTTRIASDFFAVSDNQNVFYENADKHLARLELPSGSSSPVHTVEDVQNLEGFAHSSPNVAGISFDDSAGPTVALFDPQSGSLARRLQVPESRIEKSYLDISFGPMSHVLLGVRGSNQLRGWDVLTGKVAFNLRRTHSVYASIANADSAPVSVVSDSSGSELYLWRIPASFSSSRQNSNPTTRRFVPGTWPILAFDLSQDGKRIAILEQSRGEYRTYRVRTFRLEDSAELERWQLFGGGIPGAGGSLKSGGTDIAFTPSGNILVACEGLGVPLVLSEAGIDILKGIARPFVTATYPENNMHNPSSELTLAAPSEVYDSMVLGIVFRLGDAARNNGNSGQLDSEPQRITAKAYAGEALKKTRRKTLGPSTEFGSSDWQLWLTHSLDLTDEVIRLDAYLESSGTAHGKAIEVGRAILMASQRQDASWYWLGPFSIQGDGTILSSDASNLLAKRSSPTGVPDWQWADPRNEFATVRAIASSQDSSVFGTRWGHVYHVDSSNRVRQLNDVGASDGGDTSREVASVAVDQSGLLAASGDLDGVVSLYQLNDLGEPHPAKTRAHREAITALTVSHDGRLLVTAGEDSHLRVWSIGNFGFKLEFEVAVSHPAIDLKFAHGGRLLFVLSRGEHGLQVLDLRNLHHQFEMLGIK